MPLTTTATASEAIVTRCGSILWLPMPLALKKDAHEHATVAGTTLATR
ncbi:hypothetical protein WEI85_33410 [Actinomycetes bacterium KLBMP 9797]